MSGEHLGVSWAHVTMCLDETYIGVLAESPGRSRRWPICWSWLMSAPAEVGFKCAGWYGCLLISTALLFSNHINVPSVDKCYPLDAKRAHDFDLRGIGNLPWYNYFVKVLPRESPIMVAFTFPVLTATSNRIAQDCFRARGLGLRVNQL